MTSAQSSEELLRRMAALCHEKRAEDIVALDVRGLVDYMDFLLIATGRSTRQNRAIAENVIRGLKPEGHVPLSRSGIDLGEWVCVDYVHVVLHVFDAPTRAHYDLELLWADAEPFQLDLPALAATDSDEADSDETDSEATDVAAPDPAGL